MKEIVVVKGDITKISIDAIVNAANTSLLGGSGVDGAIHKSGGKEILEDCQKIRNKQGGCKIGSAVITRAGMLPAKKVIHAVGPVWNGGYNNELELLSLAYFNSLKIAEDHKLHSISFPNISTGIFKFPKEIAAKIAIKTVETFLEYSEHVQKVIFVCYDIQNYIIYKKEIGK